MVQRVALCSRNLAGAGRAGPDLKRLAKGVGWGAKRLL